jgi:hypothetical protein
MNADFPAVRRCLNPSRSLILPLLGVLAAAGAAIAGDAPTRVVPSGFIDMDSRKPCLQQIEEQGLGKDIGQVQAAVHACMKGRFNQLKQQRPDLFPIEGKPQTNRPK